MSRRQLLAMTQAIFRAHHPRGYPSRSSGSLRRRAGRQWGVSPHAICRTICRG
jgi:hypothetical protein